jgi:hypothetical protein
MRIRGLTDPVYAPNSIGGPQAEDDDDWGQAGTLVREVLDGEARNRLAQNVIGHVSKGVKEPVLSRVFEYWRNSTPTSARPSRKGCAPISTGSAETDTRVVTADLSRPWCRSRVGLAGQDAALPFASRLA